MPFSNAGTSAESFHQSCLGKNSVVPPRKTNSPTMSNPRRKPNKHPKSLSSAPIDTEARILRSILPTKPARKTHPITIRTIETNVLVMRPIWAWNGRTAARSAEQYKETKKAATQPIRANISRTMPRETPRRVESKIMTTKTQSSSPRPKEEKSTLTSLPEPYRC